MALAGWRASISKRSRKNPQTKVTALCSRSRENAENKARELGLTDVSLYTDLDAMLRDSRVAAVSLCTQPHQHPAETIQAAQAGKHILIEKAVANDPASLKAMCAAVKSSGVKTVVSFVLHWNPQFQWINRMLDLDALGKVYYAEVDYWHNIGAQYGQYRWNVKKEIAGSAFLSAGCHAVDALRQFVRDEVIEVSAFSNKINSDYEYDTNIVGIVKFANGTIGKVSTSFDIVAPYQFNVDLLGAKGTIRDNRLYAPEFFAGATDWVAVPTIRPDSGDVAHHPFDGQIAHFAECIVNGTESFVNLEDAARTHEICFALDRSAEQGRTVSLDEISGG